MIGRTASNEVVFLQGVRFAESGNVTVVNREDEFNYSVVKAIAEDEIKNYNLYLIFDRQGLLLEYRCGCDSSRIWRGACKHVVAALCVLMGDFGRDYKKMLNKRAADRLLGGFEAAAKAERGAALAARTASEEKVSLVPEFFIDTDDTPYIELTIGINRMYVVKNIRDTLENINNAGLASYGKNLSFIHHISSFDEPSAELILFLQKQDAALTNAVRTIRSAGHFCDYSLARRFPLAGSALDIFFGMYEGQLVASDTDGKKSELLFTSEPPGVRFNVAPEGKGVAVTGGDDLIFAYGEDRAYIKSGAKLHRVATDYAHTAQRLNAGLIDSGKKIIFEGVNVDKFLSAVYPRLIRHGLAENAAEIETKYKIVNLIKKAYLDTDGSVSLKFSMIYGDIAYDTFETERDAEVRRDISEEELPVQIALQYGFAADEKERRYVLKNDDKIYRFYKFGLEHLGAVAEVYATDEFKRKGPKAAYAKTSFGVRIAGRLLEIKPEGGYNITELMDIVGAYNVKKKYYRLKSGEFIDLHDGLEETAGFINALDLSKKNIAGGAILLPSYKALFVDGLSELDDAPEINRDEIFRKFVGGFKQADIDGKIPETLEHVLRGYQRDGFRWLTALASHGFGGILADDMGLGKTIQVISLILSQKENDPNIPPSLVVAPTSLIFNWEKEINRFAPGLFPVVIAGTQERRAELYEKKADIYITTYDLLKRDLERYSKEEYNILVADEAQYIKNPGTQNAGAIKKINANARFALTGTPIENSLSELWSIFDFVMPGFLYSQNKFLKLYETPVIKRNDAGAAIRLKKLIGPFILRRLKKDVLKEIPEKQLTVLYAEMEEGQKKIYAAYLMRAKGELTDVFDKKMAAESRIKILSHITRLRQICCHPALFMENYEGGSGKLPITIETIRNSIGSGRRILLFSQFTSMLDIVRAELDAQRIPYFYLDGATNSRRRVEMADRFNAGENDIFLISLKAGGTGLNLTGADVVIHFDPWWNPAVMDQATDRAHRIGQRNVVQIFNVVAKDSIEEKIIALQEKKRDLIDLVIQDGANFINRITEEEIAELFD